MLDSKKIIIQCKDICKEYSKGESLVRALNGVELTVSEGEMAAIMGKSGSGKSTLLNIIGMLDSQTSGDYILMGENTNKYSNKEKAKMRNQFFGFIMQDFALVDRYTVKENVEIPLLYVEKGKEKSKKEKEEKIKEILKQLGIEDKLNTRCYNLSGGQRQRVAIARALINDSKVIIADEPTGALDEETSQDIMNILKTINKNNKITIIIVTHDSDVAKYCNKIYHMSNGKLI